MRKSKFTESQTVIMLKVHDGGKSTEQICREAGISKQTFYKWKNRCSGMEVNELQRMGTL